MKAAMLGILALATTLMGCATLEDTPIQTRTYAAWSRCESSFPGVRLVRVSPDGSGAFSANSPGALAAVQACMEANPR